MTSFITSSAKQTQKLGTMLARKFRSGKIIALIGELGSGKTTFSQGFLKGLGVKGPYTSPTFVVIKQYELKAKSYKLKAVYHIDAYRMNTKDILNLGWEEIIADKSNIVIIEWADRIRKIIPKDALWIKFEWVGEKERKLAFD